MGEKIIELKSSYVWLEDGIVRALSKKNAIQEIEDTREFINVVKKLAKGESIPLLLDISTLKSSTEEASMFFQSQEASSCISAMAMLLNSPSSRIIGTLLLNRNLSNYPLQIFTSEKKAIEWLNEHLANKK